MQPCRHYVLLEHLTAGHAKVPFLPPLDYSLPGVRSPTPRRQPLLGKAKQNNAPDTEYKALDLSLNLALMAP